MSQISPNAPSVVERTRPVAAGGPVVAVHILGDAAAFVLGEEGLLVGERRIVAHTGGVLASACDGTRVVMAGDDGQVTATTASGETEVLATDPKRRWIDRVALAPDGTLAWSAGKTAFVKTSKGAVRTLDVPSSVGGLAFAPKRAAPCGDPLQRRHAVVPQRHRRAGKARVEGLAP